MSRVNGNLLTKASLNPIGGNEMFKVGDKVKCILPSEVCYFGEVGKVYTVWKINPGGNTYQSSILLLEDPYKRALIPKRFELVKENPMKIGDYKVTDISKDSVNVGCTKVTRQQIEEILKLMDEAKELKIIRGKKYKWIGGIHSLVVLCTKSESTSGVVVESNNASHEIGYYHDNWSWINISYEWEMLED